MNIFKHSLILLTATFLLGGAPTTAADLSIGTVDLQNVFDNYWKTKQVSDRLQKQGVEYQEQRERLIEQYKEANEAYRNLKESAADQAVAASERDRRNNEAEQKLVEVRGIEKDINDYDTTTRTQLAETQARMKKNILREIREKVGQIAREKGFQFVFDTAAEARTETPVLVFSDGANDITQLVLERLNAKLDGQTNP